jgi:hypothetical protein
MEKKDSSNGNRILINILEEIKNISSKIFEDQKKILDKVNILDERMTYIEKSMTIIQTTPKNIDINIDGLVNLKLEKLEVEKENVIKFMSYRDYRAVVCIFRLIYKNKTNSDFIYPIRISSKRSYDYYNLFKCTKFIFKI